MEQCYLMNHEPDDGIKESNRLDVLVIYLHSQKTYV